MAEVQRYNSVAISLHWLIAFFIVSLLAMGKYMTHLEVDDPLRYTLTQLHKSVGITLLLLALFRVFWRLTHKPPALPESTTGFEKIGSQLTHAALYLLMVVIPVSGWIMVSASPLNMETVLFGVVPWPHISFLTTVSDREVVADRAVLIHTWLANGILLLVLLHTIAALFHQWVRKDRLISRMVVSSFHRNAGDLNNGLVAGVLIAAAGSVFLVSTMNTQSVAGQGILGGVSAADTSEPAAATDRMPATAGFAAVQTGEPLIGEFGEVQATLKLDKQAPEASSLIAVVMTGSVKSNDAQLDATMVTADWFASEEFPESTFQSTGFEQTSESAYMVTGDLTLKGNTRSVQFELLLEDGVGGGEFTINRSDFGVGDDGQDDFVDDEVVIRFSVPDDS